MSKRSEPLVLAIDPSSTRTGYALRSPERLKDAGFLQPDPRAKAVERIHTMCLDLVALLIDAEPTHAIIEWPSGHVGARHQGKGAGLATYGAAVGAMWWTLVNSLGGDVRIVTEDVWTQSIPKQERQAVIAARYPAYRDMVNQDRGGDVSDAIGLADYWFQQQKEACNGDRGEGL